MWGLVFVFAATSLRDAALYALALAFIAYGVASRDVTPFSVALVVGGGALFSLVIHVADWRGAHLSGAQREVVGDRAA